MDSKTLGILEYPKILERLARHTTFAAGRELALKTRPTASLERARELQAETAAARLILTKHPDNNWLLFSAIIIISREIFISSLREWMSGMGKSQVVAVSFFGKAKTVAQMFALLFLIYEHDIFGLPTYTFGLGLLVWSAILTIVSMIVYVKSAWRTLSASN